MKIKTKKLLALFLIFVVFFTVYCFKINLAMIPAVMYRITKDEQWSNELLVDHSKIYALPNFFVRDLLEYGSETSKIKLASDKRTQRKFLLILAENKNFKVRYNVVKNPVADKHILKLLLNDSSNLVLAANPLSSKITLQKIAVCNDLQLQLEIAENRNCSRETLEYLATIPNVSLHKKIASNPNINSKTAYYLIDNGMGKVLSELIKNYSISTKILKVICEVKLQEGEKYFIDVFKHPNINDEILSLFLKSCHLHRLYVASSPQASNQLLSNLIKDRSKFVRKQVAENPNISIENLKILISDSSESVRIAAQKNLDSR
ncbi:hypothetical protein [Candidatus Uabimicrobium sp. HlEnr_7]|uniref:hypothetical protein n=1 Tax=Candidatus Uabimicrobium helgolandensis TaxID=3095367 RepID=UPI003556A59B